MMHNYKYSQNKCTCPSLVCSECEGGMTSLTLAEFYKAVMNFTLIIIEGVECNHICIAQFIHIDTNTILECSKMHF